MNELKGAQATDNRGWHQRIITIRAADKYNTKRVMVSLPFLTISTMDTFSFLVDLDIDLDGVIFAISVPYLRIWIGKKVWHKYGRILNRKTIHEKQGWI